MTTTLTLVLYSAILTWLTLMGGSLIRAKGWTLPGMLLAFGNRDQMPAAEGLAGRAMRTAQNTLENFVLFAAIAIIAHLVGQGFNPKVVLGAQLFFWSRVAYIPVYYLGLAYVRTVVWGVGIIGMVMMLSVML